MTENQRQKNLLVQVLLLHEPRGCLNCSSMFKSLLLELHALPFVKMNRLHYRHFLGLQSLCPSVNLHQDSPLNEENSVFIRMC